MMNFKLFFWVALAILIISNGAWFYNMYTWKFDPATGKVIDTDKYNADGTEKTPAQKMRAVA
jgi:outer membrane protein assembly factor BamB